MSDDTHNDDGVMEDLKKTAEKAKEATKHPSDEDLVKYLREGTHTLRALCDKFDLSPRKMDDRLEQFETDGYVFLRSGDVVSGAKYVKPRVATPAKTLADEHGMVVPVGWISDIHSGSRHAQPSAVLSISRIMYEEYGVRHFGQPGDITAGVFVYRGQEEDLLIEARPWARKNAWKATENQVWLATEYIPKYPGAMWHTMGGNHDYTHVVHSGKDPIRMLSDERSDIEFMGYDSAGLWLTDKTYVRMWHPRGGVPYAKSYRLQKGMEALAVEALRTAIKRDQSPVASLLVGGHLHIAVSIPEMPMAGMHPGCFEGQTNLGKQMGLFPSLCGVVTRFYLTDSGRVQRIGYDWLYFDEIEDDWRNFPVPDMDMNHFDSEHVGPIVSEKPFASGNPHGEVTGGR